MAVVDAALAELGVDGDGVAVDVRVREAERGWTAEIRIRTADGTVERVLGDPDCETLGRAIGLIVAVTIDPFAALRRPVVHAILESSPVVVRAPVEGLEAPARPSTAVHARGVGPTPTRARPPARARRRIGGAVWAVGGIDIGLLPRPFAAVGAGVALRLPAARIEIAGVHLMSRFVGHPEDRGVGANVWLAAAQARGCWVPAWHRLEVPLCAGLEAGAMIAEGRGLQRTDAPRFPWLAVAFGPRLAWSPLDAIALVVGVDGLVGLLRPKFTIEDFDRDLLRTSRGSFRAFAGIELRFPSTRTVAAGDSTR